MEIVMEILWAYRILNGQWHENKNINSVIVEKQHKYNTLVYIVSEHIFLVKE